MGTSKKESQLADDESVNLGIILLMAEIRLTS